MIAPVMGGPRNTGSSLRTQSDPYYWMANDDVNAIDPKRTFAITLRASHWGMEQTRPSVVVSKQGVGWVSAL
jgi:hypothetical protein